MKRLPNWSKADQHWPAEQWLRNAELNRSLKIKSNLRNYRTTLDMFQCVKNTLRCLLQFEDLMYQFQVYWHFWQPMKNPRLEYYFRNFRHWFWKDTAEQLWFFVYLLIFIIYLFSLNVIKLEVTLEIKPSWSPCYVPIFGYFLQ